jgi:sulfur-oxidizing protein SoxY
VRLAEESSSSVKSLTLIVDENPSPVVATFKFGPAAGNGERLMSTRVRVDAYSNVRALAEMDDGRIYMVVRFVKGAGGCSAPAGKNAEAAEASIGKIQIKETTLSSRVGQMGEAVLMIRHPNSSGFQMDPVSGKFIAAKFVDYIGVTRDDDVVFTMEGGISLSEDPNFRFTFAGRPGARLAVNVHDITQATYYARYDRWSVTNAQIALLDLRWPCRPVARVSCVLMDRKIGGRVERHATGSLGFKTRA